MTPKTLFCSVLAAANVAVHAQQITWSEHIAPIVYKHCATCHRAGEIAPFPLMTFFDALDNLYTMRSQVERRLMPPWKPDPGFGSFLDDRRLTDQEISQILNWIDNGAPRGDSTLAPPPPVFPTGSQLGTPDLVLKMPRAYHHLGNHADMYRCFVLPTGLLKDQSVSAIEFRPGNPAIVHHALFYLDTTGKGRSLDSADPDEGYLGFGGPGFDAAGTPGGWAPGATTRFFPPGIAWKFPKNSDLVMQIHYAPTDSDEDDQSSVNIFFSHSALPRDVLTLPMTPQFLVDGPFVIPPNTVKHFTAKWTAPIDLSVLEVAPHMHLLGRMMKAYALTPRGDTMPMISISDWDFHWQGAYMFPHMLHVPANSQLVVESQYDNTENNPLNPNQPPKYVTWGESTFDEMMLCYFYGMYYFPGDENINMAGPSTGIENRSALPTAPTALLSPFADPATTMLSLPFALAEASRVTIALFDALGHEVSRPVDRRDYPAGQYLTTCSVASLPTGTYLCRMSTGGAVVMREVRVVR